MNVKVKIMKKISVTVIAVVMLISCMLGSTVAYASNTTLSIDANVYDLDKKSDYVLGENSPSESAAIGTLTIGGNVKVSSDVNSFPAYEVTNGNLAQSSNRHTLYTELERQVKDRLANLPSGSTQEIVLDVRGRGFTDELIENTIAAIRNRLANIYPDIPITVLRY